MNAQLAPMIKVYHCNSEEKCNDFIIRKKLLESNHPYDSFWLGKGMYFWDNLGNAKYWRKKNVIGSLFGAPRKNSLQYHR